MTNPIMNEYPCGCEVHRGDKNDAYICPCALHDAAPVLLAALDTLQACILADNGIRAWASTQSQLEAAMRRAKAAIAAAEGKP